MTIGFIRFFRYFLGKLAVTKIEIEERKKMIMENLLGFISFGFQTPEITVIWTIKSRIARNVRPNIITKSIEILDE